MEETVYQSRTEFISIDSLKIPEYYSKNEIAGQVEVIRKSILEFGVKAPIIVNENPNRLNVIINGVLIYEIAKEVGIIEVPVWYIDLTKKEEEELSVLLNQKGIANLSNDQIIELIGNISYENFFSKHYQSDLLKKHFDVAKSKIENALPIAKKSIKQLIIRMSDTDKIKFEEIGQELETVNQTQTLLILMEFYLNNKNND